MTSHALIRSLLAGRGTSLIVAFIWLLGSNVLAEGTQPAPKTPKCVDVRTFSKYVAYGYDHIVEVENRCDKPVRCTVKTDANPEPSGLDVGPGETKSTLTFRGSPAREFQADVKCEHPKQ